MAIKELNIRNKRARFEFHLEDIFEAGIVLTGTEIKSIRNGKASILESYGIFENGEVWLRNMHINAYENGSFYNHKPRADRKLLLQRKEITRIEKFLKIKGNTLSYNDSRQICSWFGDLPEFLQRVDHRKSP